MVESDSGVIAYERGDAAVAVNTGPTPVAIPPGEVVIATSGAVSRKRLLAPGDAVIVQG